MKKRVCFINVLSKTLSMVFCLTAVLFDNCTYAKLGSSILSSTNPSDSSVGGNVTNVVETAPGYQGYQPEGFFELLERLDREDLVFQEDLTKMKDGAAATAVGKPNEQEQK